MKIPVESLLNSRINRRSLPAALFFLTSVSVACSNRNESGTASPASASPAASSSGKSPVVSNRATARIALLRGPGALFLAKVKGSMQAALNSQGASVDWLGPFPAFSPAVEALNAGSIDVTTGSTTAAISAMAGGSPFKIFAYQVSSDDGSGILVKKDSPIQSVKDLAGKKVIVNRGGTGEYLLFKALEKEGVSADRVQRIYLGPADAGPVFAAGKADAWAVWGTFFATAVTKYEAHILTTAGEIASDNDIIYVVHNAFLDKYPEVVKATYKVIQSESQWAATNTAEAMKIYGKEFKLPAPTLKFLGERLDKLTTPVGGAEVEKLHRLNEWFFKRGVIPKKPITDNYVIDITKI